jgi:malate dehydrogenase (oxaloacetate-decarboxylating)(NADP+)
LDLSGVEIVSPANFERFHEYVNAYYTARQRKGVTHFDAERKMMTHNIFGMMMVQQGDADGLISGLTEHYPETVRPALQIIGKKEGVEKIAGLYMLVFKNQTIFIGDATVNIEPTAEDLAEIALLTAEKVKQFDIEPRIAMLSFSNFGSTEHPLAQKVMRAVQIVKKAAPDLKIDGEMQADTAVTPEIINELYPFCEVKGGANVLICPDINSANIAYKLLTHLGGATAIGPMLLGIKKPVYLLIPGNEVNDIVNITALAVCDVQKIEGSPIKVQQEMAKTLETR